MVVAEELLPVTLKTLLVVKVLELNGNKTITPVWFFKALYNLLIYRLDRVSIESQK